MIAICPGLRDSGLKSAPLGVVETKCIETEAGRDSGVIEGGGGGELCGDDFLGLLGIDVEFLDEDGGFPRRRT